MTLRQIQVCPAVRRRARFKVPSDSSPGVDWEIEVELVQGHVKCSCPGFTFRGTCHHTNLEETRCGWQEGAQGAEVQTSAQHGMGMCPRCGSPTIEVAAPDDSEAAMRAKGVAVPPPPKVTR